MSTPNFKTGYGKRWRPFTTIPCESNTANRYVDTKSKIGSFKGIYSKLPKVWHLFKWLHLALTQRLEIQEFIASNKVILWDFKACDMHSRRKKLLAPHFNVKM